MADTRRITVTEGLKELKLYDDKIKKTLDSAKFVGSKKKSSEKVGVMKTENFESNAKASYQSACDLIRNRAKLKAAITQSNATTYLEVAGKKYTVAEAIERKSSVEYDELLLMELSTQYASETATVLKQNAKVDDQANKFLEQFLGKDSDKKVSEQELSTIADSYKSKNEYELVDPLGAYEKIKSLEAEIEAFKADIDTRLSISNAVTYIELDF